MKTAVILDAGIYQNYPGDTLYGPPIDNKNVQNWAEGKLKKARRELVILHGRDATDRNEQEAVMNMVTQSRGGNHLLWYGSSHGSNNPDQSQRDGMLELLCRYNLEEENGLWVAGFTDARFIGKVFKQVHPDDTLDAIFDCCCAPEGSQLKAIGLTYSKARFMRRALTPVPVQPKSVTATQDYYRMPQNCCLWSACRPDQTSADTPDGGAFTNAFLAAYKIGRTRASMMGKLDSPPHGTIRMWLKQNRFSQEPHLYCCQNMALGVMGK